MVGGKRKDQGSEIRRIQPFTHFCLRLFWVNYRRAEGKVHDRRINNKKSTPGASMRVFRGMINIG